MVEMEDYLSKLNVENVATIDRMVGGSKGPATALPFGALQSDWARMLLLIKRTRSSDTVLAEKLARLFRILRAVYFRTESSESTSSTTEFTARNETTLTAGSSKPAAVVASNRRKLTRDFAKSNEFNTANVSAPRKFILPSTESSISTFNTSDESISKNVNDSIPTFAITDLARLTTTLTGYKKSITENVEDKQTTNRKSIFAPEVSVTTSEVKGDFERTKGRGDFSIFHDSSNLVSNDTDIRSTEDRSRFVTMRYRNVADRRNYIYNNIPVRDFQNIPSNKVFIYSRSNNDSWKYMVNYRNVTFAPSTTARSISETENTNDVDGNIEKFKKRDSLKNFRWFYNLEEKDTRVRNLPNSPTINIECDRRDGK
nr:PREDICTED: uncharacterized protein LOC105663721 [Megachile rotundata]